MYNGVGGNVRDSCGFCCTGDGRRGRRWRRRKDDLVDVVVCVLVESESKGMRGMNVLLSFWIAALNDA